jgi:Membrane protein involved in the export of O-antigen and teichoic acid
MPHSLKQQTATGLKWSAIERIVNQLVNFVVAIIMARLLTPADYGLVGMVAIFIGIGQAFVDSGFSQALIRKQDRTEEDNSTAFFFNLFVAILFYLLLFFTAPLITDFYNEPLLTPITRVIGLSIIINSLCLVQRALFTIDVDFKTQSKASVTASIISGVIGIGMALGGCKVWAVVGQQLSNLLISTILFWIFSTWRPRKFFVWNSFKSLFEFGSKLLASGLLNAVWNNMYSLFIGKVYFTTDLGYWSKAKQFSDLPANGTTDIIQRVVYPVLCKIQNESARLQSIYRQFVRLSAFVVFPLLVGLAAVSHSFVIVLLGEQWEFAADLLVIVCFSKMWTPIQAINLNPLMVLGRSDLFLKLDIIKKIISLVILLTTIKFGLIVMAIGVVVGSLVHLAVNSYYTKQLVDVGLWTQLNDIAPALILSLLMFALIMAFNYFVQDIYVELFGGILLGMIFYIGGAYLFKFPEMNEVVEITRNYILKR